MPATFFIIGENALTQRGLLERMVAEGHEIGSHTYTHPNLANVSPAQVTLELNATQRLFQAFTGRSLRLFRAPYFGDAEPTTADEIVPALEAQQRGYTVGRAARRSGRLEAARRRRRSSTGRSRAGVETRPTPTRSGNIVLLHDAGGDRAQTVAALPRHHRAAAREGLYASCPSRRSPGCRAMPVMPPITGERPAGGARRSRRCSARSAASSSALDWLFVVAITLGILRALALSGAGADPGAARGAHGVPADRSRPRS